MAASITLYQNSMINILSLAKPFNGWKLSGGDTFKVMLATSSYVPSQSHSFVSDTTNEVVGSGYTAGGVTLTNKSLTVASNRVLLGADNVQWSGISFSAKYAIIYNATQSSSSDQILLAYADLGSPRNHGNLKIRWPSGTVLTLSMEAATGFP